MKIIKVEPVTSEYITTDNKEWPIYRRNGPDSWENLMGNSWEEAYDYEELEEAYKEWNH